jgi:hypothetical protein
LFVRLVRAVFVVMPRVLGQDPPEVPLAVDEQVVEAAITARSAQFGSGRVTWRRRTATSCRNTKISTSLAVLLRASRASQLNNRIMSR